MLTRRQMLERTFHGASLVALGSSVPGFVATSARAAAPGKDKVLVVVELTGGNDGLNTVIPYADDLYQKVRPTLRFQKKEVVRVDDAIGLHPGTNELVLRVEVGVIHRNRVCIGRVLVDKRVTTIAEVCSGEGAIRL